MKKYIQPSIKVANFKTTILAGSPNPTIEGGDHEDNDSKRGIFDYGE